MTINTCIKKKRKKPTVETKGLDQVKYVVGSC